MHIVSIPKVVVDLCKSPTVTIGLPSDFRTVYAKNRQERQELEKQVKKSLPWVKEQIEKILQEGQGDLADAKHPMRSFGAGVLARVSTETESGHQRPFLVLHIRGSNRGSVWPLGYGLADMLRWKEFAGVTGSADELLDPKRTAIQELYEEIAFVSHNNEVLLPEDIASYPETERQVEVAIKRANNKPDQFGLKAVPGFYPKTLPDKWKGDPCTLVRIESPQTNLPEFPAVVNYDPETNALEMSFVADITLKKELTGILSLAGPENENTRCARTWKMFSWFARKQCAVRPYMEDVLVVREEAVRSATPGQLVPVKHLLSVHGPENLKRTGESNLYFAPAATLVPLIWYLNGTYSFRKVLAAARDRL
jgi:hypothetical protein